MLCTRKFYQERTPVSCRLVAPVWPRAHRTTAYFETVQALGWVLQAMSAPKNDAWESLYSSFRTEDL